MKGLLALVFLALGLKGYWDNHEADGGWMRSRWFAIGGVVAITLLSTILVNAFSRVFGSKRE